MKKTILKVIFMSLALAATNPTKAFTDDFHPVTYVIEAKNKFISEGVPHQLFFTIEDCVDKYWGGCEKMFLYRDQKALDHYAAVKYRYMQDCVKVYYEYLNEFLKYPKENGRRSEIGARMNKGATFEDACRQVAAADAACYARDVFSKYGRDSEIYKGGTYETVYQRIQKQEQEKSKQIGKDAR
ncbi:hypothetical protein [Treponema sp. R6D11]